MPTEIIDNIDKVKNKAALLDLLQGMVDEAANGEVIQLYLERKYDIVKVPLSEDTPPLTLASRGDLRTYKIEITIKLSKSS